MTWIKKKIQNKAIAWINLKERLFRWDDEDIYRVIPDAVLNGDFYDEYFYTHGGSLYQALCEEIFSMSKNNNVNRHIKGLEKALGGVK